MAGKTESVGGMYTGKHFSRQDKQRQNDNFLTGETWKTVPNTDFGYYSSMGRFAVKVMHDFPNQGAYLCTEDELRSEINFYANSDNIMNEAEGYTNIDYYQQFMEQTKQEEKEQEEENV